MNSLIRAGLLLSVVSTPIISHAQPATTGGIATIGTTVIALINGVLVPVLLAIAFIIFIYGIAKSYIFSQGDEAAVKTGHQVILWGLVGFFVILSVWGLVNVVVRTFNLDIVTSPRPPEFTPWTATQTTP